MAKSATYFGFKPRWKQSPDFAPPAVRRPPPDFTPVRREYNKRTPGGFKGAPPQGPRMSPGRLPPRTIDLSPKEYKWNDPVYPGYREAKRQLLQRQLQRFGKTYGKALLKGAAKLNPYIRVASWALDAYDWMNQSEQWMAMKPGELIGFEGFYKYCDVPYSAPCGRAWRSSTTAGEGYCNLGAQPYDWYQEDPPDFPVNTRWIARGNHNCSVLAPRMTLKEIWNRPKPAGGKKPVPIYAPGAAWPMPMNYAPPRPMAQEYGRGLPREQPFPELNPPPYVEPALTFEPQTGSYGSAGRRNPGVLKPHYNARPWPGEKEDKRVIFKKSPGAPLGEAFGAFTEALDALDALYKAIPGAPKRLSYNEKLVYVAKNIDRVEWSDALANFLEDQLKDAIIAKVNRKVDSAVVGKGPAAKYWNGPFGLARGHGKMFHRF